MTDSILNETPPPTPLPRSRWPWIVAIVSGLIIVAGCTSPAEPAANTTQPETVAADVESVRPKTTEPEPEPTPTQSPVELSPRGNVVGEVGKRHGAVWEEGQTMDEAFVQFKVTNIKVDGKCTEDYATPPENGHMIFVDLEVSTASNFPADLYGAIDFNYEWSVIGPDGLTESALDTMATYGCLPESGLLPADGIGPGEKVVGTVVLDSKHATGTLVFKPWWMLETGWEWVY